MEGERSRGAAADFRNYARGLVKYLGLKGTIRTAVEGMNLARHWNEESDILAAECIRTFPTVTFPATLLLKREETETNKLSGVQKKETSVIAALYHGRGDKHRMYREAPFDLLYGFRGHQDAVDLLAPYEMLLHYSMSVFSRPPTMRRGLAPLGPRKGRSMCRHAAQTV